MVTYADVREWKPDPLDAAERLLKTLSEKLLSLSDEFADMGTPEGWTGEAAEAARKRRGKIVDRMEQIVAGVAAARTGLMDAADGIVGLCHAVNEAEYLASAREFRIGDDGTIHDRVPADVCYPPDQEDEIRRERARVQAELVDRVEQIMRRATDIDNDLTAILDKVTNDEIDTHDATTLASAVAAGVEQGQASVLEPPKGKGTPGDNAGWWDTLSPDERRQIVAEHPEWIGNRDGIPFTARDQANRARLVIEKEKLLDEKRRLEADLDDNWFGGVFTNADARLDQVNEHLNSIAAIEETLGRVGERQLLLLDNSSDRSEAAIAVGNVDTADHVAVFTPGLTSNVADSMEKYDAEMRHLYQRATYEADKYGDGGSVATVTWIGYQAPQLTLGSVFSSESVALDGAAYAGADKLAPFLQGIDAARDSDPHLTALGHSYGSTTTGLALQNDTGVDEAVFFGSPGLGTSHIDNLHVPDGHSTYIENKGDPVGDFGAFGIDPTHMDGMHQAESAEARHPDTGERLTGPEGGPLDRHGAYLNDGSTSQYNMSVIVGGMPDRVLEGDTSGAGDIGSYPIPGTY